MTRRPVLAATRPLPSVLSKAVSADQPDRAHAVALQVMRRYQQATIAELRQDLAAALDGWEQRAGAEDIETIAALRRRWDLQVAADESDL